MEYLRARLGFMAPVFAFFAALLMCRRLSTEAPGTVAPEPRDTESPVGKAEEEKEREKEQEEEEEERWGEQEGGTLGANGVAGEAGGHSGDGQQRRLGDGAREGGERLRQSSYREGDGVAGGTMQAPRVLSMGTGSMSAANGLGAAGTACLQLPPTDEGLMIMTPITGKVVKSGVEGGVGSGVQSGLAFPHPNADHPSASSSRPPLPQLSAPSASQPGSPLLAPSAPSASHPGPLAPLVPSPSHPETLAPLAPPPYHPETLPPLPPSPSHPESLALSPPASSSLAPSVRLASSPSNERVEPLAPSTSHPATLAPPPYHPAPLAPSPSQHRLPPQPLAPLSRLAPEAVRSASFLSPSPKPGSPAGSAAERPAD